MCERGREERERGGSKAERERAEQLCADVGPVGWSREGEMVEQRKSAATAAASARVETESEQAKRRREAEARE